MKSLFKSILLLLFILSFLHCGSPVPYEPSPGTFKSVYSILNTSGCTECHTPGGSASLNGVTLDFSSQTTAYTTLTTAKVSGTTSKGTCGGIPIVKSGIPAQSYLAGTVFSDYRINNFAGVTGCQPYTHLTAVVSGTDEASIITWIQNGAQNN